MSATAIWKFPLDPSNNKPWIDVPRGARFLSTGVDPGDNPCIWAEVDKDAPTIHVPVRIVGTGHTLPEEVTKEGWRFLGTVFMRTLPLVWHIYILEK